jgi:5-formyltetrahydrofolate cyclo-ligase
MPDDLVKLKKDARAAAGKLRAAAHAEAAHLAADALVSLAFPAEASAHRKTVSGFFPYKSEIDVRPLLGRLAGEGWVTSLPIVTGLGEPLIFRRWYPGEPTVPGLWDIPRPLEAAELVEPDVLLVPMLAFDRAGYRLGYGGGFYDRTLALLRGKKEVVAIGVAYAAQEVASVPHDDHDARLDFVMTEEGVIRF